MNIVPQPFDERALRNVLGTFVTGVTVVTTRDKAGTPHGVTANSFSSVSIDPPLILWSQSLTSRSYPAFRELRLGWSARKSRHTRAAITSSIWAESSVLPMRAAGHWYLARASI